jgi:hypothetical protein
MDAFVGVGEGGVVSVGEVVAVESVVASVAVDGEWSWLKEDERGDIPDRMDKGEWGESESGEPMDPSGGRAGAPGQARSAPTLENEMKQRTDGCPQTEARLAAARPSTLADPAPKVRHTTTCRARASQTSPLELPPQSRAAPRLPSPPRHQSSCQCRAHQRWSAVMAIMVRATAAAPLVTGPAQGRASCSV